MARPAWGAGTALGGMAGLGFAWARCNLTKPPTSSTVGAGAGTATGRRLVLAGGKVFAAKPQTRQVSPVCQPALQWDCSWVFIMSPLHQCIFCASMCSPEPQPNIPQLNIPQPMQRHPAQCHLVKDTFPFSLDKVPPVFFLVPTARVVASAVPHFPGLPAHPSWAFVGDQWGGRREH